jgi:serine/threonine-protein kinase
MAGRTGSRVGPFEIVAPLGAGGMGEVYRARDARLQRDVAIKILPESFAADADRRARFGREARVLASLNHPHIATLYGVEDTAHGQVLVMELVEGETLADRLSRTGAGTPVRETLAIAQQVAAALETAHERGIVHRDLKPANIMVRPDGTVKVLDFGVARTLEDAASGGGSSPTVTMTEAPPGIGPGTPAYMSPEQLRGARADTRADIWAFGCVLYELLIGRRPFDGATASETAARILEREPELAALPPETPAAIRRLLRRCLEKDPRERLRHIGDARLEIREASSGPADTAPQPGGVERAPRRTRAGRWTPAIAAAVLSAVVTVSVLSWLSARPSAPIVRSTIPEGTFMAAMDRSFAITPDGSRLTYFSTDATEIRVRPFAAMDATTILDTAGFLHCLFVSPDGQWVGYVENNYTLKKIPMASGATVPLLTMDGPARGASWGPGNDIVFATGEPTTGLQRISADGGPATVLTRPDQERGERDHVGPVWLPDGRGILFTILSREGGGLNAAKVAVFDVATGQVRTLIQGGHGAMYVADGYLLYAAAGALWATRFDVRRLETEGAPVKVLPSVPVGGLGGVAHFDVSANGTLVYPRDPRDFYAPTRVPVWVDRHGRETAIAAAPAAYQHPRLSPDGTQLAVVMLNDIYLLNLAQPKVAPRRLTFHPSGDWFPVWTPDGRQIAFGSWRGGALSNLYIQETDAADAVRLTDSTEMQLPTSISPDGTRLIFHSFPKDVAELRLGPPHEVRTLAGSPLEERNGALSPDGRWLAYEGESPGRPGLLDVFVRPFPEVERGAWQVTRNGGTFPLWSRTGRELYYLKPDDTLVAVPVEATGSAWRAGTPADLFRGPYSMLGDGSMGRHYDVAADGRFLMLKDTPEAAAARAHFVVVQNWLLEVAQLMASPAAVLR